MNGHIDIKTLSEYFLNKLTRDEETLVQEHISSCPECRKRLEAMRRLSQGIFGEDTGAADIRPVFTRIIRSAWTKAAAALIIVTGIGYFTYETVSNRNDIVEQTRIQNSRDIENEVFAIDTFDAEDSLYYQEKYGDDFLNSDSL